jgi:hypothetical protein
MTDPRIEKLGLPELMLQLDHPERALVLFSELGPGDIQVDLGPDDPPHTITRVECWVEEGDQYIFTWRKSGQVAWSTPEWGEYTDGADAGTPVTSLEEARDGLSPTTAWQHLHPALRGPFVKKALPFEVACLESFPQAQWVGKTVLHPMEQTASGPAWNTDDYAHKDPDNLPNDLVFDLGIVLEVFEHPDSLGGLRCRFLTEHGSSLHYGPDNLWVPILGGS